MILDFDDDDFGVPQTSPVHKPAFDYNFDIGMTLPSPVSAPLYSPNKDPFGTFERPEEPITTYQFQDVSVPFKQTTLQQELEKSFQKPLQIHKRPEKKKKPIFTCRPFVSLEAAELTVHQLRSVLSRPIKPHKATQFAQ